MFCSCGYWATSLITQVIECPICQSSILVRSKEDQGRHAWTLIQSQTQVSQKWFDRMCSQEIPSHGCRCREHWQAILSRSPPPFDPVGFQFWAIDRHNEINDLLIKPKWPDDFEHPAMSSAITPDVARLLLPHIARSTKRGAKLNLALSEIAFSTQPHGGNLANGN